MTGRTGLTLRAVLPPGGGVSVLVLVGLVSGTGGTAAVVVVDCVEITAWTGER